MLYPTVYISPFLFSVVILAVLGIYAWLNRTRNAALAFFFVIVSLLIWVVGFIFEIVSVELPAKLLWANIQFFGITGLPIAWLAMATAYTGHANRFKKLIPALAVVPLATIGIIWTNPLHHLFRKQPWIDTTSSLFPILVNDYGIWFSWFHVPLNAIIFIFSFAMLVRSLSFKSFVYRRQIIILVFSTAFPLVVDTLYVLGVSPIPNFNLTSVAFSISGVLIGYSLFQYQFLDLVPAVRSALIETMQDGWIVLDYKNRFVDLNQIAGFILGYSNRELIGNHVNLLLADHPEVVEWLETGDNEQVEGNFISKQTGKTYDVRLSLLPDKRGQASAKLIVLRDITFRKKMQEEREQLVRELQSTLAQLNTLKGLLPICAHCKKIRDDEGYWHQLEGYIEAHSDAEFTHGLCPECKVILYPGIFSGKK